MRCRLLILSVARLVLDCKCESCLELRLVLGFAWRESPPPSSPTFVQSSTYALCRLSPPTRPCLSFKEIPSAGPDRLRRQAVTREDANASRQPGTYICPCPHNVSSSSTYPASCKYLTTSTKSCSRSSLPRARLCSWRKRSRRKISRSAPPAGRSLRPAHEPGWHLKRLTTACLCPFPPFPLNHNLLQLATRTSVTLLKGGSTFRTDHSLVRRPVRAQQPDDLPPLTLRCLSRPPARFSLDATHPSQPSFFPTRISVSFASHLSALLDALLTFLLPSSLSDVPTFTSHVVALAKIGMYPVIAGYV